eukprot:4787538-Prymnesium_polylepis.1
MVVILSDQLTVDDLISVLWVGNNPELRVHHVIVFPVLADAGRVSWRSSAGNQSFDDHPHILQILRPIAADARARPATCAGQPFVPRQEDAGTNGLEDDPALVAALAASLEISEERA